jgi:hypothetical protein
MQQFADELVRALAAHHYDAAVNMAQPWTRTCAPGDPDLLLQHCPLRWRDHVAELLCDLLAGYPSTWYGVPVLLRQGAGRVAYNLPEQCDELDHNVPSAWLDCTAALPLRMPLTKPLVCPRQTMGFVGLLEPLIESHNNEDRALPRDVWQRATPLSDVGGVTVCVGPTLRSPLALAAARIMLAAATGQPPAQMDVSKLPVGIATRVTQLGSAFAGAAN